ncbi:MAG TPA: divalent-cation tolerance protein CutA [Gammaproteobacteria bacterium]
MPSVPRGLTLSADPLLVMTTCADAVQARELATALVAQRLAACVNSLPHVSSTYRWDGKIERSEECLLLIKTTRDRFAALEREIKARSRYELPEVLAVRVDGGSAEYLSWVEACVAT